MHKMHKNHRHSNLQRYAKYIQDSYGALWPQNLLNLWAQGPNELGSIMIYGCQQMIMITEHLGTICHNVI